MYDYVHAKNISQPYVERAVNVWEKRHNKAPRKRDAGEKHHLTRPQASRPAIEPRIVCPLLLYSSGSRRAQTHTLTQSFISSCLARRLMYAKVVCGRTPRSTLPSCHSDAQMCSQIHSRDE